MLTASGWALPRCCAEKAVSALSAPCKSSDVFSRGKWRRRRHGSMCPEDGLFANSLSTFSHGVPNPAASQKGVVLDQPFRYPHVRSVNLDTGSRHGDEPRSLPPSLHQYVRLTRCTTYYYVTALQSTCIGRYVIYHVELGCISGRAR